MDKNRGTPPPPNTLATGDATPAEPAAPPEAPSPGDTVPETVAPSAADTERDAHLAEAEQLRRSAYRWSSLWLFSETFALIYESIKFVFVLAVMGFVFGFVIFLFIR